MIFTPFLAISCLYATIKDSFNPSKISCFNSFISEYDKDLIINLIYYHDINIDKMSDNEVNNMIQNIGEDNINLLFDLKRADLLAQSLDYPYLLEDIHRQEEKICGSALKRI